MNQQTTQKQRYCSDPRKILKNAMFVTRKDQDHISSKHHLMFLKEGYEDIKEFYSINNNTPVVQFAVEITAMDLGHTKLHYDPEMIRLLQCIYKTRRSDNGNIDTFLIDSNENESYNFRYGIRYNTGKSLLCTPQIKLNIISIVGSSRLSLTTLGEMCMTFGLKELYDNAAEERTHPEILRSVIYDKIVEEIEGFKRFLKLRLIALKTKDNPELLDETLDFVESLEKYNVAQQCTTK